MRNRNVLAATTLALSVVGCAGIDPGSTSATVEVPAGLRPGTDETLALVVPASGVQIYECREVRDHPGAFDWVFVAPEADLFDRQGTPVGRHYAGPHWEATDGSRIQGTVKGRADAPAADAIPWLLLAARSVGPRGAFSAVTSIQRVNTAGGTAPTNGCSRATAGQQARVAYTADYHFFAAR